LSISTTHQHAKQGEDVAAAVINYRSPAAAPVCPLPRCTQRLHGQTTSRTFPQRSNLGRMFFTSVEHSIYHAIMLNSACFSSCCCHTTGDQQLHRRACCLAAPRSCMG
jgi:hypothetical protein